MVPDDNVLRYQLDLLDVLIESAMPEEDLLILLHLLTVLDDVLNSSTAPAGPKEELLNLLHLLTVLGKLLVVSAVLREDPGKLLTGCNSITKLLIECKYFGKTSIGRNSVNMARREL